MKECCRNNKQLNSTFNFCPECGMYISDFKMPDHKDATILPSSGYQESLVEEHEAYGQLLFSRRTGNKGADVTLYGSTIRHQNTISLVVKRSRKYSDEFTERYSAAGGLPLIEIEMSQTQFSEAITSMNMGDGVPVTLRTVMGKYMAPCNELTLRQKLDRNLKGRFTTVTKRLDEQFRLVEELATRKGTLSAGERKELISNYRYFLQEIRSNLPFLKECLDEVVDKSVCTAKDEIESFWMNRIHSLGIERFSEIAQQSSNPTLIEE